MHFEKWQGLGNDFIIITQINHQHDLNKDFVKLLCDRHFGIGADGVISIEQKENGTLFMHIINSDGSVAKMCGNGARCLAKFLFQNKNEIGITSNEIAFQTLSGLIQTKIGEDGLVCVDMGEPRLLRKDIPIKSSIQEQEKRFINETVNISGIDFKMTAVSMGNPHCVIFTQNLNENDLIKYGTVIENHYLFKEQTNVEFVKIENKTKAKMLVWERGAGRTLACGTGACAVLVAGYLNNLLEKKAEIELEGGLLKIEWQENGRIYMTGEAKKVFSGTWQI